MTDLPNGRSRKDDGARAKPGGDVFELDPVTRPEHWKTLLAAINEHAAPILEARRQQGLMGTLAGWRRPVFTGAAGLAAAAVAILLLLPAEDGTPVETMFAEAMMPWSVAAWMDGSYTPTVEELVQAVEEEYAP